MRTPLLLLVLLSSTALAGEPTQKLPKADIEAIVKAIQDGLPPVDKVAVKKCTAMMDEYNNAPDQNTEKLFDIGVCMKGAGSLGAAVQMFKLYQRDGKDAAKQKETVRTLAIVYETAAMFSDAAEAGERYAKSYAGEKDAKERLVRATCIRRQLGDDEAAMRNGKLLERSFKLKADDTLCAKVRPIAMPAKKK